MSNSADANSGYLISNFSSPRKVFAVSAENRHLVEAGMGLWAREGARCYCSSYKSDFVSIRNVYLGTLIIVWGFRFFFKIPVLLCLLPLLIAMEGAEKQMVIKEMQETR